MSGLFEAELGVREVLQQLRYPQLTVLSIGLDDSRP